MKNWAKITAQHLSVMLYHVRLLQRASSIPKQSKEGFELLSDLLATLDHCESVAQGSQHDEQSQPKPKKKKLKRNATEDSGMSMDSIGVPRMFRSKAFLCNSGVGILTLVQY